MPRHARAGLALFALTLSPAFAQPTRAPEHCATIAMDIERLACYDAFFRLTVEDTRAADDRARAAADALVLAAPAEPPPDPGRSADAPADNREVLPFEEATAALANAGRGSLLDRRWELARDSKLGVFNLRAYKPIYALPFFWAARTNELPQSPNPANSVTEWENVQPVEGKFQLSFKTKIAESLFGDNGDLWGAYTQTSRWQLYNGENSRPFRETNYEPELMLVFRNRYHFLRWSGRMAGISLNHQSNGQSDPRSRSWNRIVATVGLDRENWALVIRPWWRLPEGTREDNNPGIEDYIGRADAMLVWRNGEHEISAVARHSLRGGERSHGSLQLDWGFPLDGPLRGHVQVFSGYGESLIDYNHASTYVGVGISLLEWF